MELRSGQVLGEQTPLPPLTTEGKVFFEEGVQHIFKKWSALCLAVEQQWGGPSSADKANWLLQESINWFYRNKDYEWEDLADELEDALIQDFNLEAQDGSVDEVRTACKAQAIEDSELRLQVARSVDSLYKQCCRQDYSTVLQLRTRASQPSGAARSQRQVVDRDGTLMGDADSSSDEDDDMQEDVAPQAVPLQQHQQAPQGPVIDEDGFELVQGRGRRGARR